jgi:predicted NBD/HSP70 family sugar kinase
MKHVASKSERDKRVIEAIVRRYGPLSRVDIHERTYLRPSTISALVQELLTESRLVEAGRSNNPVGRKQVLLQLNEQHGHVLAIEFDNQSVLATVMDLHPKILARISETTYFAGGAEGLIRQLIECGRGAIKKAGISKSSLVGIGIADPGLVNSREGTVVTCSTIEFWKDIPLKSIFEKRFSTPTLVDSKTRAKAVSERALGAGRMVSDMLYVDYGAGIGAGLILEGKVLRGHRSTAGEFGHTHVLEDGPACPCGSFGCLEAIIGAAALETRARKAVAEGARSIALQLAEGDVAKLTVWDILKAAHLGDKTCLAITEQLGNYLGVGLANLVNLFNPLVIVLDERLSQGGEELLNHITRVIKRQALTQATDDLMVDFGKLGGDAGILGIGLTVLDNYFEIPGLKLPKFMIEEERSSIAI